MRDVAEAIGAPINPNLIGRGPKTKELSITMDSMDSGDGAANHLRSSWSEHLSERPQGRSSWGWKISLFIA